MHTITNTHNWQTNNCQVCSVRSVAPVKVIQGGKKKRDKNEKYHWPHHSHHQTKYQQYYPCPNCHYSSYLPFYSLRRENYPSQSELSAREIKKLECPWNNSFQEKSLEYILTTGLLAWQSCKMLSSSKNSKTFGGVSLEFTFLLAPQAAWKLSASSSCPIEAVRDGLESSSSSSSAPPCLFLLLLAFFLLLVF